MADALVARSLPEQGHALNIEQSGKSGADHDLRKDGNEQPSVLQRVTTSDLNSLVKTLHKWPGTQPGYRAHSDACTVQLKIRHHNLQSRALRGFVPCADQDG